MPKKIIIPREAIEKLIMENLNITQIAQKLSVSAWAIKTRLNRYGLKCAPIVCREETKQKISAKRKQYLLENPDKHVWKRNSKFKSKPCEIVKEFLRSRGILFVSEFSPMVDGRFFSLDIALPDKLIGLEINGNQHYERSGKLKPYYKERHDILENNGWKIYQIHYSACFDIDKWEDFANQISNSVAKVEFDYFNYIPRKKANAKNVCDCGRNKCHKSIRCLQCVKDQSIIPVGERNELCSCGNKKHYLAQRCINCFREPHRKIYYDHCQCGNLKRIKSKLCRLCNNRGSNSHLRVAVRPSREELERLIWELPLTKIGDSYGVSANSVKKWCRQYGITNFPGRGFWS